jgi:hypothetical protein
VPIQKEELDLLGVPPENIFTMSFNGIVLWEVLN